MVRAILAGTKTQTRRIVRSTANPNEGCDWAECLCADIDRSDRPCMRCSAIAKGTAPYGVVGDRLWVREGVRRIGTRRSQHTGEMLDLVEYTADDSVCNRIDTWVWKKPALPGIFLPRGASRITLEISDVRIERVQAISEEDAKAEGVTLSKVRAICPCETNVEEPGPHIATCRWRDLDFDPTGKPHVDEFAHLWNSINGKRAPWSANPWVWVLGLKRVDAQQGTA